MAEADTVLVPQPAAPARLRDARHLTQARPPHRHGARRCSPSSARRRRWPSPPRPPCRASRSTASSAASSPPRSASRPTTPLAAARCLAQADTRLVELEELACRRQRRQRPADPRHHRLLHRPVQRGVGACSRATTTRGAERTSRQRATSPRRAWSASTRCSGSCRRAARDDLVAAGRTLTDLDLEVSSACPTCTGGITTIPDFLAPSAQPDLLPPADVDAHHAEGGRVSGQDLTRDQVPEQLAPPPAHGDERADDPGTPTHDDPRRRTDEHVAARRSRRRPSRPRPTDPAGEGTDQRAPPRRPATWSTQIDDVTGGALGGPDRTVRQRRPAA